MVGAGARFSCSSSIVSGREQARGLKGKVEEGSLRLRPPVKTKCEHALVTAVHRK